MLRFASMLIALSVLAACAAEPAPAPSASRFTGVPGSSFHTGSTSFGVGSTTAGFGAPTADMGNPAQVGHFGGAMEVKTAIPTSGFHPSGIPTGWRPVDQHY